MDALSEVLKALRLTSGLFLDAEFTAPWCIDSAPGKDDVRHLLPSAEHVTIYHLVTEGRCRARLPDGGDYPWTGFDGRISLTSVDACATIPIGSGRGGTGAKPRLELTGVGT